MLVGRVGNILLDILHNNVSCLWTPAMNFHVEPNSFGAHESTFLTPVLWLEIRHVMTEVGVLGLTADMKGRVESNIYTSCYNSHPFFLKR